MEESLSAISGIHKFSKQTFNLNFAKTLQHILSKYCVEEENCVTYFYAFKT